MSSTAWHLPDHVPAWTAVTSAVIILCYVIASKAYRTPLPGIPYNKKAARLLMGDLVELGERDKTPEGMRPWFLEQAHRHNSAPLPLHPPPSPVQPSLSVCLASSRLSIHHCRPAPSKQLTTFLSSSNCHCIAAALHLRNHHSSSSPSWHAEQHLASAAFFFFFLSHSIYTHDLSYPPLLRLPLF
jgi:hypothetical protein